MTTSGKSICEILAFYTKELKENKTIDSPRLDCEVLLSHILNCSRIDLLIKKDDVLSDSAIYEFQNAVSLRKNNVPVSYITKEKEFMSLSFDVDSGILVPRPETEILVELVINHFKNTKSPKILDLCTGSGAIAVSLAHYIKKSLVTAVDKYDVCINFAGKNAANHGVLDRVKIMCADVLSDIDFKEKFDCIVSNPPYIKTKVLDGLPKDVKDFEPGYALDGGDDGLIFYKKIVNISKKCLSENGLLAFEIGFDQADDVKDLILKTNMFHSIKITKDYAGLDRIVTAIKGII